MAHWDGERGLSGRGWSGPKEGEGSVAHVKKRRRCVFGETNGAAKPKCVAKPKSACVELQAGPEPLPTARSTRETRAYSACVSERAKSAHSHLKRRARSARLPPEGAQPDDVRRPQKSERADSIYTCWFRACARELSWEDGKKGYVPRRVRRGDVRVLGAATDKSHSKWLKALHGSTEAAYRQSGTDHHVRSAY